MSRILYVAPFCHIPPVHGASQRGIYLLLQLARRNNATLLTYRKHDAAALEQWCAEQGIALGWLPDPPAQREASFVARAFARRPPGFASHCPRAIAETVDQVWAEHGPFDVVYFATQILGQAALVKRWPARLVLDLYDVYAPIARSKIGTAPASRPYHWLFRLEAARAKRYERRVVACYDIILVSSAHDADQLARLNAGRPAVVIPNGVELPTKAELGARPPAIMMVASFSYAPNLEGFLWFYRNVWPLVREHNPQASLVLVGEGDQPLRSLTSGDDRLQWAGRVPDLRSYYPQAACVIVPIQSGGGTRLKLLEAMAWGVPVVSTSLGAQGVDYGQSIGIADLPEQFARAVLQRLQCPDDFKDQADQARKLIEQCYTWSRIGEKLLTTIG